MFQAFNNIIFAFVYKHFFGMYFVFVLENNLKVFYSSLLLRNKLRKDYTTNKPRLNIKILTYAKTIDLRLFVAKQ